MAEPWIYSTPVSLGASGYVQVIVPRVGPTLCMTLVKKGGGGNVTGIIVRRSLDGSNVGAPRTVPGTYLPLAAVNDAIDLDLVNENCRAALLYLTLTGPVELQLIASTLPQNP